jgi:hypothetical protein
VTPDPKFWCLIQIRTPTADSHGSMTFAAFPFLQAALVKLPDKRLPLGFGGFRLIDMAPKVPVAAGQKAVVQFKHSSIAFASHGWVLCDILVGTGCLNVFAVDLELEGPGHRHFE